MGCAGGNNFIFLGGGVREGGRCLGCLLAGSCFIPPVFPVGLCWGPERAALPAALFHASLSGAFNKSHAPCLKGEVQIQ